MRRFVLIIALLGLAWANPAEARRVALIIGNSTYQQTTSLPNPPNDARLVANAARSAGFDVTLATDLSWRTLGETLREFRQSADGADVAMIYYAGHGIEGQGKNWLIPVDAKLQSEFDLPYEAIEIDRLFESLSGAQVRMIVLDACRNNPFGNSWKRGVRAVPAGLADIDVYDVLVMYAAAPGQVAADGSGGNSPFAQALARRLPEPGLAIQLLGGAVRDDVLEATGGKQRPFVTGSMTGTPIYLVPEAPKPQPIQAVAVAPSAPSAASGGRATTEALMWQGAFASDTVAGYQAFLTEFPNGIFANIARDRITKLQQTSPSSSGTDSRYGREPLAPAPQPAAPAPPIEAPPRIVATQPPPMIAQPPAMMAPIAQPTPAPVPQPASAMPDPGLATAPLAPPALTQAPAAAPVPAPVPAPAPIAPRPAPAPVTASAGTLAPPPISSASAATEAGAFQASLMEAARRKAAAGAFPDGAGNTSTAAQTSGAGYASQIPLDQFQPGIDLAPLPQLPATPRFPAEGYPNCMSNFQAFDNNLEKVNAINQCTMALDRYYQQTLTGFRATMASHQSAISRLYSEQVGGKNTYTPESQDRFYKAMMKEHADSDPNGIHFGEYREAEARYHRDRAQMQQQYCTYSGTCGTPTPDGGKSGKADRMNAAPGAIGIR
ncbi:MAG: caspase family protein [Caenibius sp.]